MSGSPIGRRVRRLALAAFILVVATATIPAPVAARPPSVNGRLAFDRDDGMVTSNPDGSAVRVLWPAGCCAVWSPDGRKLAVADLTEDGRFSYALINPDGTGRTSIPIDVPTLNVGAEAWSPDGRTAASAGGSSVDPNLNGIWLRRADNGTHLVQILSTPTRGNIVGDFSPDGSRVVFVEGESFAEDARTAIFTIKVDGTHLRQVTPWGMAGCCTASWSPDGRWIVFDTDGKLYVVHPDGSGLREIPLRIRGDAFAFEPDWSPDGRRIAFSMYVVRLGQDDIYTADPDGRHLVQVTNTPEHEGQVDWGTSPELPGR